MPFPPVKRWILNGTTIDPVIIDPSTGEEKVVVWAPQPGSQEAFLACTESEVLFAGTRAGCGKSDALLMAYMQHVGQGWNEAWKGIIIRQTFPQLREMIDRCKRWIPRMYPTATYNEIKYRWDFPGGESLVLSHFAEPSTFHNFQGHEYTFIGWEELVTWPNLECYKLMFSCLRSPIPNIPKLVRATTNPYGPSHNAIKARFNLPIPNAKSMANPHGSVLGPVIVGKADPVTGYKEPDRRVVHGHILENKLLLKADPKYIEKLKGAASDENRERAWIDGDWNITAGGLLDHAWNKAKAFCVLEGLTPEVIPPDWRMFRAYDHGYSKPFAVGWFAISNGDDIKLANGKVRSTRRGDLFLVKEWYGCTGNPDEGVQMLAPEITKGIIRREIDWGWRTPDRVRVKRGPADSMIFDDVNGVCIANEFEKSVVMENGQKFRGIVWEKADKGPNSRTQGWDQIRQRFQATIPVEGIGRERPGLFISSECHHWLRTVPVLPRDEKDMEDCPENCEDHHADMTRYALRYEDRTLRSGRV